MLNCFQRFTFTFTAVVLSRTGLSFYEKKYDAKLYLINVQYSRRAQRTQIQEYKEYSCPMLFDAHFFYVTLPHKHTNY